MGINSSIISLDTQVVSAPYNLAQEGIMKKAFVLFVALVVLGGCAGPQYVVQRPVFFPQNVPPPYPQAPGGTPMVRVPGCPFGASPAFWDGQPVCVSQTTAYSYNPGFGWGVVTGVLGVAIIQSIFRGGHNYHHGRGYRR